jgi:hypothetical protein
VRNRTLLEFNASFRRKIERACARRVADAMSPAAAAARSSR